MFFFLFEYLPSPELYSREQDGNYASWHLAYENQVSIAETVGKNVIHLKYFQHGGRIVPSFL